MPGISSRVANNSFHPRVISGLMEKDDEYIECLEKKDVFR